MASATTAISDRLFCYDVAHRCPAGFREKRGLSEAAMVALHAISGFEKANRDLIFCSLA